MKTKLITISLLALSFGACKKTYTCECEAILTQNIGGSPKVSNLTYSESYKEKEDVAQSNCSSYESSLSINLNVGTSTGVVDCELK